MEDLEIWKDIPEWEGYYQASSFGGIRSIDRFIISKTGKRFLKGKILKAHIGDRYLQVVLSKPGIGNISKLVHVLVCTTFHEKPDYACEVLHGNNVKLDNRATNLRWGTHMENIQDAIRDGLNPGTPFGWERPKCRFNKNTYRTVFVLFNEGSMNKEQISKKVGVQSGTVHKWVKTYVKHRDKINKLLNI